MVSAMFLLIWLINVFTDISIRLIVYVGDTVIVTSALIGIVIILKKCKEI